MTKPIFFIIPSKKYKKCINIYLEWLLLGWLLLSIFADFEQVKKPSSYFPDFEQVKKTGDKNPWEKLDVYASPPTLSSLTLL